MALNKNVFYATNPARIADALWHIMTTSAVDVADMLIFLPSRRAVRTVEKMIAQKKGGVAILPQLVALGEGVDEDPDEESPTDVFSNIERVIVLTKMLAADATVGNLVNALPVAHDLVRMQDYLENEGIDPSQVDWAELIDGDRDATHFQNKAKILNILSGFIKQYAGERLTSVQKRNQDVRAWINRLDDYKLVVVCASTASVPPTADLMCAVANCEHGRIILSGKIAGREQDFVLDTNPYNSEYKFLQRLNMTPADVVPIDVGPSVIDFMNWAFGNDFGATDVNRDLSNCHRVLVPRESDEALAVAEIASRAVNQNKSVLVITPDAAGNQRIATAFKNAGLDADFSSGVSGTMTPAGRAILNLFDEWIETDSDVFDRMYMNANFNLLQTVSDIVDVYMAKFRPHFKKDDVTSIQIWTAIESLSNALDAADVRLSVAEARTFLADAIGGVSVRGVMNNNAKIIVLGTIESRMQTADVVILTGLNEGMFPARGYENSWLSRRVAKKIGLPSPDRKVSLQSLDFMNMSCGGEVYWVRTLMSGGVETTESRFLSRVVARNGLFDTDAGVDVLTALVTRQYDVPDVKLDYAPPSIPRADWSDMYVTDLEYLIHNPYAYYVRHILKLNVLDDYWEKPDSRKFGNLVHAAVENVRVLTPDNLYAEMDKLAQKLLGQGNLLLFFWRKRFMEMVPFIVNELTSLGQYYNETRGSVSIAGRVIRAKADVVWAGGVLDFKTGKIPTLDQMKNGMMPQLPLEALMLQSGGFSELNISPTGAPIMKFLKLQRGHVGVKTYTADETQAYISAAVEKATEVINQFSAGNAPYEYRQTQDDKYKNYDDLARRRD